MRSFIVILTISAFLLSCGQNENKQKEPAGKEKEIAATQNDTTLARPVNQQDEAERMRLYSPEERFLGEWSYKDQFKADVFLKITKNPDGSFNVKKGHVNNGKISWGNMDFSIGNGVNLKLVEDKLKGSYRAWGGSAADSEYEVEMILEIHDNGTLCYKSPVESFEAGRSRQ